MKKRILSLALAFAMMATAVVVPGAKAEAASDPIRLGMIDQSVTSAPAITVPGAGDVDNLITTVKWTDGDNYKKNISEDDWFDSTRIPAGPGRGIFSVGDKIEINIPGDNVNSSTYSGLALIKSNQKTQKLDSGDLKADIVRFNDGDPDDFEILGSSYTFKNEDLDDEARFAVLYWVPLDEDDDDMNGASGEKGGAIDTAKEVVAALVDEYSYTGTTSMVARAGRNNGGFIGTTDHAYGLLTYMSDYVKKPVAKGESFVLDSATAKKVTASGLSDAKNLVVDGKTIYIQANANETTVGADALSTLELTFKYEKETVAKADKASHENTKNRDAVLWSIAKINPDNQKRPLVAAPTYAQVSGFGQDGFSADATTNTFSGRDASLNTVTEQVGEYFIYVTPTRDGDYYDGQNEVIKTDYKLVVVNADPKSWIKLNLGLGENEEIGEAAVAITGESAARASLLNGGGTAMNFARLGYDNNTYVATLASTRPAVEMPAGIWTKRNTETDKVMYFQGWSEQPNSTSVVRTGYQMVYGSKTYYAVWGSMPVAENGAVYRVHNTVTGEHLYTGELNEYAALIKLPDWNGEGVGFYGVANDVDTVNQKTIAVRRLFNTATGEHLYVEDGGLEMRTLLATKIWLAEKIVFVSPSTGDAIYRLFNPAAPAVGQHLWTMNTAEMNILRTQYGWQYEGVPFNSVPK